MLSYQSSVLVSHPLMKNWNPVILSYHLILNPHSDFPKCSKNVFSVFFFSTKIQSRSLPCIHLSLFHVLWPRRVLVPSFLDFLGTGIVRDPGKLTWSVSPILICQIISSWCHLTSGTCVPDFFFLFPHVNGRLGCHPPVIWWWLEPTKTTTWKVNK